MFLKYHFPPYLWATVILLLTLLPAASMPEVPDWELISFHTASHAVVFFLLAFLLLRSFYNLPETSLPRKYPYLLVFIFSIAFGAGIEFMQTSMNLGRQGDAMDILSNSIGTVLGILFFSLIRQIVAFKKYL